MADKTTNTNEKDKDKNQNQNNSGSNSSTGKKETAEEKAAREKKEAEEKAKKAEEERLRKEEEEATRNYYSKLNEDEGIKTTSVTIKVDDNIKKMNYTLPEVKISPVSNKISIGLDSIMDEDVKQEFNTYNYFGIFDSFDDYYVPAYDEAGREIYGGLEATQASRVGTKGSKPVMRDPKTLAVMTGQPAVRSLFNRYGQVLIGNIKNIHKDKNKKLYWTAVRNTASEWRISNNVPLMDSPENRKRIRQHSGCTVAELVKASSAGDLGRAKYTYADFMYCKYLGRISNNYLITLRRFPIPPGDCITTTGTGKSRSSGRRGKSKSKGESNSTDDQGCMVTWLGTPGNEMSNILKYSVIMPFEEKKADWEDIKTDADSSSGFLPSIAAAFNDSYRMKYCQGYGGEAFNSYLGGFFGGQTNGKYNALEYSTFRDKNKTYGPIDAVKKIYKRSEEGLDFKQNITIVFDYELRSYNGINPRQAMLDLISNILNVTYSSGGWWGGGYRGGGMAQSSIFTNLNIFKNWGGTFTGFCDALQKDYQTLTANLASQVQSAGGILQYCLKLLNNIGGMIMGGLLNKMGRPARAMMNSLLSEQPVGFWHLMVGNPHHPIMSVGNMILKNTTIEHYGPLGLDDFPTGLKVTCELDRGKPRDNREIEKMYMNGNDRIYSSIGPKIVDMYQSAAQYKADLIKDASDKVKQSGGVNLVGKHGELNAKKNKLLEDLETTENTWEEKEADVWDLKFERVEIVEYINNHHESNKYIGRIIDITGQDVLQRTENLFKELHEQGVKDPKVYVFTQIDEKTGKPSYYTATYIPSNDKTYDSTKNMYLTKYPNDYTNVEFTDEAFLSELVYDMAQSCLNGAIDSYFWDGEIFNKLDDALNDVENSQNELYSKEFSELDKINEKITAAQSISDDYAKAVDNISSNISQTESQIKENEELQRLSNKLQQLTDNLDSWEGDELFSKLSKDEQVQILQKIADTDWYKLFYTWFGSGNMSSISMASQEIEYGSYQKKDVELTAYNPEKIKTVKATKTMLKDKFDRHDWKNNKVMDVSVQHVDGDGNVHKVYAKIEKGEVDAFLAAYEEYLTTGDLSKISSFVNTEAEKDLSHSSIQGLTGGLDASKVVPIPPKDPPQPPVSNDGGNSNPGGADVPTGNGSPTGNMTTNLKNDSNFQAKYNAIPTPSGNRFYIKVVREYFTKDYTLGKVYVGEPNKTVYYCDLVEDRDRGLDSSQSRSTNSSKKVHKLTAIAAGVYSSAFVKQPTAYFDGKRGYHYTKYIKNSKTNKGGVIDLGYPDWNPFSGILIHGSGTAEKSFDGTRVTNPVTGSAGNSWGCLIIGRLADKGGRIYDTVDYTRPLTQKATDLWNQGKKITVEVTRKAGYKLV